MGGNLGTLLRDRDRLMWKFGLGLAWAGSIVAAVWVTAALHQPEPAQTVGAPRLDVPGQSPPQVFEIAWSDGGVWPNERDGLLARIAEIEEQLGTRDALLLDNLANELIRKSSENRFQRMPPQEIWNLMWEDPGDADIPLFELGEWERRIFGAVLLAIRGKEGVRFLRDNFTELVPNPGETDPAILASLSDRRTAALEMLGWMNRPEALTALLDLSENTPAEYAPELHRYAEHVAHLPTETVILQAHRLDELLRQAIRFGGEPHQISNVAAHLYFTHGYDPARVHLYDPRLLGGGLGGALKAANNARTTEAYSYLQWIGANHTDEETRNQAIGYLTQWNDTRQQ